jgi:multicomponent Na+:H+ antiporter subunit F
MTEFYLVVAIVLLISLIAGVYQVSRGPSPGDRMLVIQLLGTGAVAVLILVGQATGNAAHVDAALVLALLAAVTMVAFVRCAWAEEDLDEPGD